MQTETLGKERAVIGLRKFRPATTEIHIEGLEPIRLALHETNDVEISDRIRRGEILDPHVSSVLRILVAPGSTFVDVGANIGWFTTIGSKLVGKSGRVYALEPERSNLRILRYNIQVNRCDNVVIYPVAAGAKNGQATLFKCENNQGDHRLELVSERSLRARVRVKALDSLVRGYADLIKIDTQGSESNVLKGAVRLLLNSKTRLVLEYWPFGLQRCGSSVAQLAGLLNSAERSIWLIRPDAAPVETCSEKMIEMAKAEFSPESQRHADLVSIHHSDVIGIKLMRSVVA